MTMAARPRINRQSSFCYKWRHEEPPLSPAPLDQTATLTRPQARLAWSNPQREAGISVVVKRFREVREPLRGFRQTSQDLAVVVGGVGDVFDAVMGNRPARG